MGDSYLKIHITEPSADYSKENWTILTIERNFPLQQSRLSFFFFAIGHGLAGLHVNLICVLFLSKSAPGL